MMNDYWNRPMACMPWKSYRYRGNYGWIMIGAMDDADALRQASRSTRNVEVERLQKWNGTQYVRVS